ncbi:MAG: NAD(P)/FAD-dependent oxidoreductase [Chloroflexi bacterium]|uniref:Pyridine nucleotide-disulfide oxidoreductase domain-containing protein 2 n=1 Tax=Candidatus Chlorohelix allophototropha TaxID=3003348 RepID=A0A8T7LTS1_9CHLR|nr:NAD(P)/FAD-dependent oxidoreductase [Chloroflexota bacterium]WJW66169.1 NAD(P)/FAD-dependent oxidoreductase [Chloroflexota bacterium L227-S17]
MNTAQTYDVIVIGAGHNGLTSACYLAKAGYKVLVLERRGLVGGAVITETDIFPGYRLDTCSSFHVVINGTPVVQDLNLEKFGLDYIEVDPWGFAPFPNGNHIIFYRDVDKTAQTIAKFSPEDAESYRRFMQFWMRFNETMMDIFCYPPSLSTMTLRATIKETEKLMLGIGDLATKGLTNAVWNKTVSAIKNSSPRALLGSLREIITSYGKLIKDNFKSLEVQAALTWLGAQSGPGPDEPFSGELFAMQQSLYHLLGVRRPRGGSGMLTQAMARCLEHYGGEIKVNAEVSQILIENGKVKGVEINGGEKFFSSTVISNAHVQTTLLKLTPEEALQPNFRRKVENIKVQNGFGMTVRYATDSLPNYTALPTPEANGKVQAGIPHNGMQLLCPSTEYLAQAYRDAEKGLPPTRPAVIAMTPSAIDDTLAPAGKNVLYLWAQTHPYQLSNGENWDEIKKREADKCLQVVEDYAPGIKAKIVGEYIKSPLDIERIGGMVRGNLMHVDMSLKQMFHLRPLGELSNYHTPVGGLYLTGASTHPGGGVSGAAGYNTAGVVLSDLKYK